MRDWFGRDAADAGRKFADTLLTQLPPQLVLPGTALSTNRIASVIERISHEARDYRDQNRLGMLARARLGQTFKWRLLELGYSQKFVDMATEGLLVYMHRKPEKTDASRIQSATEKRLRKAKKRKDAVAQSSACAYTRSSPSEKYTRMIGLYRQMHEHGELFLNIKPEKTFPGLSLLPQAGRIKKLVDSTGSKTLLDYGSGKGAQYDLRNIELPGVAGIWPSIREYWGVEDVSCYDPAYTKFSDLPQGTFDAVICTDVLEHCPEEDIPWILGELFSYANKFVFANVACYPARKKLPTGENAHCTIRPHDWWMRKVLDVSRNYPALQFEIWVQMIQDDGKIIEKAIRG
jgi:hypothetical protein